MDQQETPLYDAIDKYRRSDPVRFHVPGHKGRGGEREDWLSYIDPYDVTEIPGLDDLHHAEEAILEAQQLAAEAFGAEQTFFLVGGSTVGNLAMLLTVVNPGDLILVQRNVHKSVIHGLFLSQARPVYLKPRIDPLTGLATSVSLQEVKAALKANPQVKAMFLSNPNYYGMGVDLTPYADLCKAHSIPLLVDEAHGAHFGLIQELPPSAMQAGASAAVQSTHKMLTSLTMSSMLHIQGEGMDRARLRRVLAMLQSSSPSYPLMASLDMARHYTVHTGKDEIRKVLGLIEQFIEVVQDVCPRWLSVVREGVYDDFIDPFKIILRTVSASCNGFALKDLLEKRGIYPEMADPSHVLLALSPKTNSGDLSKTLDVLRGIRSEIDGERGDLVEMYPPYCFSQEVVLTPHEVFYLPSDKIPFSQAVGHISGEVVAPYPPGVPTLNPGERIDEACIEYLQKLKELGCRFHGAADSTLDTIRVIKEEECEG